MSKLELVQPQPSTKPDDYLINSGEVAAILDVSISWVNNHCGRVRPFLPYVELGSGPRAKRKFRRCDILQFINEHLVERPRKRA